MTYRVGSADWYDQNPNAPTRAEAEQDLREDRLNPREVSPEFKAWLDSLLAKHREANPLPDLDPLF